MSDFFVVSAIALWLYGILALLLGDPLHAIGAGVLSLAVTQGVKP